jgi:hypothetical protein
MKFCAYVCGIIILFPILLTLLNVLLLLPPTPGFDHLGAAERSLQVQTMGTVRLWHVKNLKSINDFSIIFSTLGKRAKYVNTNLQGEYAVERLPIGVWGFALSYLLNENHKRTLPWTGQRFIPSTKMTDGWGDNSFTKTITGQQTRSQSFFTNYDEASHYDGRSGSIVLDYGSHVAMAGHHLQQ